MKRVLAIGAVLAAWAAGAPAFAMPLGVRMAMWGVANAQDRGGNALADALDAPEIAFATGGDAEWATQGDTAHGGGSALKSGAIGDGQETWVEASVDGAGTVSFWWKASSEHYRQYVIDYAAFSVDGQERLRIGGEQDWTNAAVRVEGGGTHVLRWAYVKDSQDSSGSDCAWLDAVSWAPSAVANVAVDAEKGEVSETAEGYLVTAKEGKTLTEADILFGVVSRAAYRVEIAEGGKSATVTLAAPVVGVMPEELEDAPKDDDDPSGALVVVDAARISARPQPKSGETVGALPVKSYEGLYYRAAWGGDLTDLAPGEKVKATGSSLYLGVIKQNGAKGYYKLTVSEK